MFPAKRNPDGFVAQRILPPAGDEEYPRGSWLLAAFNDTDAAAGIVLRILTDAEVADWPNLVEAPTDD